MCSLSGADPGFPIGGSANSPWVGGGGHQHTDLPHFLKKLHEIEKISGHMEDTELWVSPLITELCANSCAPWLLYTCFSHGSVKTCSVKNSSNSLKRAHTWAPKYLKERNVGLERVCPNLCRSTTKTNHLNRQWKYVNEKSEFRGMAGVCLMGVKIVGMAWVCWMECGFLGWV